MVYDLIILGTGAAGLTASIYSSRYKLNHLVFGEKPGGQISDAHLIENYPGFKSITGAELAEKFFDHAKGYGVEIIGEAIGQIRKTEENGEQRTEERRNGEIKTEDGAQGGAVRGSHLLTKDETSHRQDPREQRTEERINGEETVFEVATKSGKSYQAKTLILAMGARHRALNVPGEDVFLGRGVSYCATCDAPLYKDKTVAVVGGGDSALTAALLLAEYAVKVYLIHRGADYRGEPVWVEKLRAKGNVVEVLGNEIVKIMGKGKPENNSEAVRGSHLLTKGGTSHETFREKDFNKTVGAVELKNEFQGNKLVTVDGVFVEVGLIPAASLVNALGVTVTPDGSVQITADGRTDVPGIFGAGDLCRIPDMVSLRQIITSAAQGALAAASSYQYLHKKGVNPSWG